MKKAGDIVREFSDERIQKDARDCSGMFFVGYSGVNSVDLTILRRGLGSFGSQLFVTKNSFINFALKKAKKDKDMAGFVDGPTALIFVHDDPVGPAKILTEFVKTHESMKLRGGYLQERLLEPQDFKMLASIPGRTVLYQQLACVLIGPVSKLAMDLNQIITKLCYALKALSDKKSSTQPKI